MITGERGVGARRVQRSLIAPALRRLSKLAAAAILLGAQAAAADSLCGEGEQAAFACAIKSSEKRLSICLRDRAVLYRFGKPGHIELEYPGDRETAKFVRAESPYPDGLETVLRFERGGVRYLLDHEDGTGEGADSFAWLTVTRGEKQLAKLECATGMQAKWALLDAVLPAVKSDDALGAASGARATGDRGASGAGAKSAAQALSCTTTPASLALYPAKVAAIFRKYAETADALYAFAVKQFGAPQGCALKSENDPKLPGAENPDETNFSGVVRYRFAGNAELLFVLHGPLDLSLIAPGGFADPAQAKAALEARAGFKLARAKKVSADDLQQALSSWIGLEGASPPAALGPGGGTQTQGYSDPSVDADEQTTFAELTTRGPKLVAIRTHQ